MKNIISIEDLTAAQIHQIIEKALSFLDKNNKLLVPNTPMLQNKSICNIFFENSTRTKTAFELSAKYLGANVVNIDVQHSSVSKGESELDTMLTLQAMGFNAFVVRHRQDGFVRRLCNYLTSSIINAGDGKQNHPTQALLDMLTIRKHKKDFTKISIALIGDIEHSRVARSNIQSLTQLGCEDIRLIGPKNFLPDNFCIQNFSKHNNIRISNDMNALEGVDVIMTLRIQTERIQETELPDTGSFFQQYGLTTERLKLAKNDVIVMHPGPINRSVEIANDVADGKHSVILEQVTNGVAVRMAIFSMLNM